MRGRKPTPTAMKQLHGNPGKRALPAHEPKPTLVTAAPAPAHLGRDARKEWRRKMVELAPLGLAAEIDLGLLEVWCSAKGDFVAAERALKRDGIVIEDKDGNARRSPWTFVKAKAVEQLIRVAAEFGFSPASRPRIGRTLAPLPNEGIHGSAPQTDSLDAYLAANPGGAPIH
jgi:P27 family predicted phage terminase small subunit